MKVNYYIESGKLIARSKGSHATLWESDFGGVKVFKIFPLEDGDDCIVLLDPGSSKQTTFENLMRIDSSGYVRWRARLPRSNDAFADVLRCGDQIEATTWNGMRVQINVKTGQATEKGFSK